MNKSSLGRVLIVDDERPLLALMEQYLRRLGYAVTACRSGQEAWQLFEQEPSSYSLVIADILMPKMSGRELLLKMFELNPQIRILICTGYPFDIASLPPGIQERAALIQKPFSPAMLAESVAKVLNGPEPDRFG